MFFNLNAQITQLDDNYNAHEKKKALEKDIF